MSKFEVADEAITALWYELALDLQKLTTPHDAAQAVLHVAHRDFFRMLANFPQYVIAGVSDTALGAREPVLRVVISDAYKRHATFSAKRRLRLSSH